MFDFFAQSHGIKDVYLLGIFPHKKTCCSNTAQLFPRRSQICIKDSFWIISKLCADGGLQHFTAIDQTALLIAGCGDHAERPVGLTVITWGYYLQLLLLSENLIYKVQYISTLKLIMMLLIIVIP